MPKKGEILVRQNGAVIQNIDLVGDIRVEADNVVIRNVRVSAPQSVGYRPVGNSAVGRIFRLDRRGQ